MKLLCRDQELAAIRVAAINNALNTMLFLGVGFCPNLSLHVLFALHPSSLPSSGATAHCAYPSPMDAISAWRSCLRVFGYYLQLQGNLIDLNNGSMHCPTNISLCNLLQGPMFISLAAFTVYGALGYQLTAAIAFPAISLFNLLRFPLMMLPEQILNLIQV